MLYTDPDADSWFVREADDAVPLGTATFVDPADGTRRSRYLDEAAVIAALRGADVDAVWVGWGFVAEHASFAQACEEAGITFVGPNSATIRRLGDKVAAKRVAEQAGVPVVPWSGGPVDDVIQATSTAAQLGYPLVVKAASGGGGRGIRMVRDDDELAAALPSARAEAQLAFGDPTVFLEKLVPAARHVEVQVIADGYGTVWAVGIRDCSLQRRHQKVLEESASTVLDAAKEQAIRDAAVRLCAAADYRNAGTVEFLVDPETGSFQFMEVNTRLQVEHPVTEVTTGLRPGEAAAAHRAGRPADRHTADGLRARDRGAAERRGSRERIRSRAGPAGPSAAARGQRYSRRCRRSRGRPYPGRLRLDDRQDRGVGPRPRRGDGPAATGVTGNHRGGRRRHDQPLASC